jgi:hypothetical protein
MATFTDDLNDDGEGGQDGKGLRKQLEAALAANRQLQEQLSTFQAEKVLSDKGFTLVKPEELKGVAPDQIEAHAQKLQTERAALQQELLKDALTKLGIEVDGDALEDVVAGAAPKNTETTEADAASRIRGLGRQDTRPVTPINPDKLHGFDAIRAGIEQNARNKRRV